MTNFGDLDAMDDADWDKVNDSHCEFKEHWAKHRIVLEHECQEQLLSVQGSSSDFQRQP
jgi:hypothetical protein